ncbi:polysaccharide pyruvyl transferase family protein [Phenylobacterium sp.]|uniref:polysaccharide pyruvyl transferase family protein n=1 Tax=Phenylobacterium sp. TaxID=1871053 RepID=UPI00289B3241|nr:polysaccharide pyruvyl transferase family protein [Phenylobacterium sp.]
MAAKAIKIGLLWHSPNSGNLGVGALTVANMAIVRQVALELDLDPRFTIIGMRDDGAVYVSPGEADLFVMNSRTLLDPRGALRVIREQDCILDIGAGDSFADIYGFRRFLFLWLTKIHALIGRTPLVLSPQTIGPFTKFPYRQLAAIPLKRADSVLARDRASLEALRDLAPDANGRLSVDVAFALPYVDRSAERGGDRLRLGVNVSGLLFNEAESGRNRFGLSLDYAQLMRRFIAYAVARPGVEVHLVPHATADAYVWDDDGRVADRLAAEFPSVVRVPNFTQPSDAKSYISSLDFLVAGRMHACIGAFSSGTPVVPVAYSRKFSGLFGLLAYKWMIPTSGVDLEGALRYLEDCLDRRQELAADIANGMREVDDLLGVYRAELRRIFASAVA